MLNSSSSPAANAYTFTTLFPPASHVSAYVFPPLSLPPAPLFISVNPLAGYLGQTSYLYTCSPALTLGLL